MRPILEIKNISKKFRIHHQVQRYLSLRDSITSIFNKSNSSVEEFYALKNISFEVFAGDTVAIVGRNGAGKSTLLKILSKITPPSSGSILCRGRLASLLEVGTGFHPELTGRENIFFNGSVLGMKRLEIEKNFDAIVEFSGVEKFLDTALKHYSSGMQLRLAFAVAAFLENEILIVDEVLAVGDAEFQKKCLGKMTEVSNSGRTIIYVSHNLGSVLQLCNKGVLLNNGEIKFIGSAKETVDSYVSSNYSEQGKNQIVNTHKRYGSGAFRIESIELLDNTGRSVLTARTGENLTLRFRLNRKVMPDEGAFRIDFAIDDERESRIGWFSTYITGTSPEEAFTDVTLTIARLPYGSGRYSVTFYTTLNHDLIDYIHQAYYFDIEDGFFYESGRTIPKDQTNIYIEHKIDLT